MSNDIELLEEALDMETASRQMDLAQMGYNAAVETEANKTREMHELKPASWWAQTFNTDGELRRREEGTKISMSLNTAKRQKETYSTWQTALSPSADKFKNGPYQKIIRELKKSYQGVSGKSASAIRSEAVMGDLDERNALLWAYSTKAQLKEYKALQVSGGQVADQLLENTKQMQGLKKPSVFAQVFNTAGNKAFVQQREQLLSKRAELNKEYQAIKDKREPLRQGAHEHVLYAAPMIAALELKHPDLKKKHEESLHAPSPLGVMSGIEKVASVLPGVGPTLGKEGPKTKKTPAEIWGIAPANNSSYNKSHGGPHSSGHPFALSDPLKPPTPKNLL